MSAVQRIVQKAAVRVVASELDRRSAPIEQALRDLQTHVGRLDAAEATARAQAAELEALRASRASLQASHDRLQVRLDAAIERLNADEDTARNHEQELVGLRFDLDAARRSLGDLTAVLERLTQPG